MSVLIMKAGHWNIYVDAKRMVENQAVSGFHWIIFSDNLASLLKSGTDLMRPWKNFILSKPQTSEK